MSGARLTHPTTEQLTRCGAIWDGAQAIECETILYRVGGYRIEVIHDFALLRWEQLGHAVQADITRAMLSLGKLLRTAV
jgi:hypothetical protein